MSICFVLINVAAGNEQGVYKNLSEIPQIVESHLVSGDYDIIAKIKINDIENLQDFITSRILSVDGVKDVRTLTGLKLA
jgi:DNA-binding Lrp family transcriptional regulator